jgi:WD40 repeat protein
VRDTFKIAAKQAPQVNLSNNNVVISDIAWSMPQQDGLDRDDSQRGGGGDVLREELDDSLVAVAGSNGVVVVWNARQAFLESSSPMFASQQPEAILNQHTRAVNRLDWHPTRPGLLLTASQVSFS